MAVISPKVDAFVLPMAAPFAWKINTLCPGDRPEALSTVTELAVVLIEETAYQALTIPEAVCARVGRQLQTQTQTNSKTMVVPAFIHIGNHHNVQNLPGICNHPCLLRCLPATERLLYRNRTADARSIHNLVIISQKQDGIFLAAQ